MPKSVPMFPNAALPLSKDNFFYLLQGMALDRDRKITIADLFGLRWDIRVRNTANTEWNPFATYNATQGRMDLEVWDLAALHAISTPSLNASGTITGNDITAVDMLQGNSVSSATTVRATTFLQALEGLQMCKTGPQGLETTNVLWDDDGAPDPICLQIDRLVGAHSVRGIPTHWDNIQGYSSANQTAVVLAELQASGRFNLSPNDIHAYGQVQVEGLLKQGGSLEMLNKAGNGWVEVLSRGGQTTNWPIAHLEEAALTERVTGWNKAGDGWVDILKRSTDRDGWDYHAAGLWLGYTSSAATLKESNDMPWAQRGIALGSSKNVECGVGADVTLAKSNFDSRIAMKAGSVLGYVILPNDPCDGECHWLTLVNTGTMGQFTIQGNGHQIETALGVADDRTIGVNQTDGIRQRYSVVFNAPAGLWCLR